MSGQRIRKNGEVQNVQAAQIVQIVMLCVWNRSVASIYQLNVINRAQRMERLDDWNLSTATIVAMGHKIM
jgi:hypothetical protein